MENINIIILAVMNSPEMHQDIIENTEEDARYLHNVYEGFIEEKVFISLIIQSKRARLLKRFLSALIISVDSREITNSVFSMLLQYKGKYRESILIGLAHCPLSYYQLIALNKLRIDEALYQLINLFICYDCFTIYDLQEMLRPWKHRMPQSVYNNILYCIGEHHAEKSNEIKRICNDIVCSR